MSLPSFLNVNNLLKILPDGLFYIFDLFYFFKKKITGTQPITNELCTNIENIIALNFNIKSFYEVKKKGISGICRVKNGDDFLFQVILSYLNLCDEVIIINNNSTDQTKKISLELIEKFGDRIKYLEYPVDTYQLMTEEFINCPSNSIYSFAYASNFAISQAHFQYIIKVDDDNLLITERAKNLRNYILKENPIRYINCRGINIIRDVNNSLGIPTGCPYSGRMDYGVFPISPSTYFAQGKGTELLQHPYMRKRFGELYIHLKFLKKNKGLINQRADLAVKYANERTGGKIDYNFNNYSKISEKIMKDTLTEYNIN